MTSAWGGRLRLALRMGILPEAFWRLSATEWRALTRGDGPQTLGAAELEALIAAYPDEVENERHR